MNKLELEEMNRAVIADFRANGGDVGGQHASIDIVLLHHQGVRSGQARVTPLAYVRDGEDMLVVASTGGGPRHPAWYWNLKAQPRVTIEVGTETVEVIAREVADEEYARLWAMVTEAIPVMLEYQSRTTRRLPIVRLTPALGTAPRSVPRDRKAERRPNRPATATGGQATRLGLAGLRSGSRRT